MLKTGWSAALWVALVFVSLVAGCGSGSPSGLTLQAIKFETQAVPGGGAGQLYNVVVLFGSEGGALLPDQFSLSSGVLPPGLRLVPDREDKNADGIPDVDGALTGHARIIGFPRETGSFTFTVKGISTGGEVNPDQPDLSAAQPFTITVVEGSVAILTPPSEAGTTDPAVPAYDEVIPFVNPANPSAFYSFAFLIAGGTNNNINNIYVPRELELSSFDAALDNGDDLSTDTDESPTTGNPFDNDFSDGGWFVLQAGNNKVQVGGFQSPRGPVGTITSLNPEWFQREPGAGPPQNSRRDFQDSTGLAAGDTTLGTPAPVKFSDYFSLLYEDTDVDSASRRKYPFTPGEYANAFFVPFVDGVDVTPLQYRIIVESIDTKGTRDKLDDQIARVAYIVRVQIPNINIDTVALPAAQCGVDYTEIIGASGGVPPLSFELEYVDSFIDGKSTENNPGDLDKASFGLEVNETTGQFFGFGRAQGDVDLTVRVFAAVMNPTQGGDAYVPTGGTGEFDGKNPLTGAKGRHKTIAVSFAAPPTLLVSNASLTPGVDGFPYPNNADTISGVGGVPTLVPDPIGFMGDFPADARRTFTISASYIRDASHGANEGVSAAGLPNALVVDGVATSPTNGVISGTSFDRGFHPVTIQLTDFFLGPASAPSAGNATIATRVIGLSISPDSAIYMRGGPAPGGQPTGLEDFQQQMLDTNSGRNVPMVMAASLFKVDTGGIPKVISGIPEQADILPVMIANGGSDAHNNKSIPSISGYWPGVSSFEEGWNLSQERDWTHLQQRMTWITLGKSHNRVFLWAESITKKYNPNATSGGDSKRYQQYDANGDRGIMITNPVSGDFWFVCRLSNSLATTNDKGSQFGAEVVMQRMNDGSGLNGGYYGQDFTGYWKYYYQNQTPSRMDRELLAVGLSSFIENTQSTSSNNWYKTVQGRAGVSVAVSADGIWCATALPGGTNEQKILLWRTDKQPIPAAILANSYVTALNGESATGAVLNNTAAIFHLGGESFAEDGGGTFVNPTDMRRLNADSLMFVEGGLIFTQIFNMDRILGLSIVDGHLSTRRINVGQVNAGGTTTNLRFFSSSTLAARGQYIPDADYLKGLTPQQSFSVQFAFTGNEPEDGEAGPSKVAFVAGETALINFFSNDGAAPIDGKQQRGNRNMSLMFLEVSANGSGLNLDASTMKDLTGSDPDVYGDLLTPGRPGEEQDYVRVSPDGNFAAVVRDYLANDEYTSSSFSSYRPTFATPQTSSTSWNSTDDILLISTTGIDMDSNTSGTQHVLFMGTRAISTNGGDASGMPSYASSRNVVNGRFKKIHGLEFSTDSKTLFFNYASDSTYTPKTSSNNGWGMNPDLGTSSTFSFGVQQLVQIDFRNGNNAIAFKTGSQSAFAKNPLTGFSTGGTIGDTSPPFSDTHATSSQQFWATFRSSNNSFLYYISDQYITTRNYMVGFNMTDSKIGPHDPFKPFSPHSASIGFKQFECNSFNYENRFASVPAGVTYQPSGRDGDGILLVIASDASGGATTSTDLEVYAFDANSGGDMFVLSSDVTNGTSNALNDMYLSADGNFLIFFRAETASRNRSGARGTLNGNTDMCCVDNIHAVLFDGAAPNAFYISENQSHGSSVAFVGEGTATGPQAVIFSSGASGSNASVDDRTLKISLLAPGQTPATLDSFKSHYEVLIGARTLDDDFTDGN